MNNSQQAAENFANGCNCAQSVLLAFCDELGMDAHTALKVAESFGGGMAGSGSTCGALTGALMVLGLRYGRSEPGDKQTAQLARAKAVELIARFEAEHGATLCRRLLGGEQTPGRRYSRGGSCADYVESAARIAGELLNEA